MSTIHYLDRSLVSMPHQITVCVIGAGGNGSHVLTQLARMDHALKGLGREGLMVYCFDPDEVSPSNVGRQLFTSQEIGMNKAVSMINKINSAYCLNWVAVPKEFDFEFSANILIVCVDTLQFRKDFYSSYSGKSNSREFENKYILDMGNLKDTGQAILSTPSVVKQPESEHETVSYLPSLFERYPHLHEAQEDEDIPSCSMAEALAKQDLFINSTLSQYACRMLWGLLKDRFIQHAGVFVNNQTMETRAMPLEKSERVSQ